MFDLILSITVLASLILFGGAFYLWRKKGRLKQATLMAILAFVMLANVAVWMIPVDQSDNSGSGTGAAPGTASDD